MKKVIMYATKTCPYCERAEELLATKGVKPEKIFLEDDASKREEMLTKSGGRKTVPQIFIGNRHVGGFDDLYAADVKGHLDEWLT